MIELDWLDSIKVYLTFRFCRLIWRFIYLFLFPTFHFFIFTEAANAIGPPLMIIGILFAGFYIKIGSLPIVADWVPYFSLFRWSFEVRLSHYYIIITRKYTIEMYHNLRDDFNILFGSFLIWHLFTLTVSDQDSNK